MYVDPYEKFVRLPGRKPPAPTPIVPRERVQPPPKLEAGPDPVAEYRLAASSGWTEQPVSIRSLATVVSKVACMPLSDILGPCRMVPYAKARHIAMWLARRYTGAGTPKIAKQLRRKDHDTILHGIARVDLAIREAPICAPASDTPKAWAEVLWAAGWPALARRDPLKART